MTKTSQTNELPDIQQMSELMSKMFDRMEGEDKSWLKDTTFLKEYQRINHLYVKHTASLRMTLLRPEYGQEVLFEKYRAKTEKDFICSQELRTKILSWINGDASLPHLILASKHSGTGKSTLIKMLANMMDAELWFDNPRTRGIDGIRKGVADFLKVRCLKSYKFVCLDEADGASGASGDLLKTLIEETANSETPVRFFFTTNNLEKLDNALRSRCPTIELANDHFDNEREVRPQMRKLVLRITKGEGIPFLDDSGNELPFKKENAKAITAMADGIVDQFFPDMREMINFIDYNRTGISLKKIRSGVTDLEEALVFAHSVNLTKIQDFAQKHYANVPEIIRRLTSSLNRYFQKGRPMIAAIDAITECDKAMNNTCDARIHIISMFMKFVASECISQDFINTTSIE